MRYSAGSESELVAVMLSRPRALPTGFVALCLPTKAPEPPSGPLWLHGDQARRLPDCRPQGRRQGAALQPPGNDLPYRFPLIVETFARLRPDSCIIDGEAVACDDNGVASFNLVRYRHHDESIFLYVFDLIELNGHDLRPKPLEARKATLEMMLAKAGPGIRFNEHIDGDGETVFRHACKLGLEGIVSKRKDSVYSSGRSPYWLKVKNSAAPAAKREAEEEWGKKKRR
jgi:bifunctional non-homologous end joining protein LigD